MLVFDLYGHAVANVHRNPMSTRITNDHSMVRFLAVALLSVLLVGCNRSDGRASSHPAPGEAVSKSASEAPLGVGVVYTANERGGSLSRIDLTTGRVTTFPIGLLPHNVQISSDGRRIFAVGSLPGAMNEMAMGASTETKTTQPSAGNVVEPPGELLVLDAAATDDAQAVRVQIGREPAHVIVDAEGVRAYTTNAGEDAVFVVDLAQRRVIDKIATGASPHGLRASPDGREIYVATTKGNAVSVLDVARRLEITRVPVGHAPVQIAFLPDGTRAYVSLRDDNAVAVLDTRTRHVLTTIPVGRSPIQLFATPDGRFVYVANPGTEAMPDDTVSIIDTRTNRVVKTLKVGRGAHGVVVSGDGRRIFIANTFADTVSVIDGAAQSVLGTIPVGAGAGGITYRVPTSASAPRKKGSAGNAG
jgi:YVTN family beta-propeller protein